MAAGPPAPQRLSALRGDYDYGSGPLAASHNAFLDEMAGRQTTPRFGMSPAELRRQMDALREFEATAEHRRQKQRAAQSLEEARSHYRTGLATGRVKRPPPPMIFSEDWAATSAASRAYRRNENDEIVRNLNPSELTYDERVELAKARQDYRMRHSWRFS